MKSEILNKDGEFSILSKESFFDLSAFFLGAAVLFGGSSAPAQNLAKADLAAARSIEVNKDQKAASTEFNTLDLNAIVATYRLSISDLASKGGTFHYPATPELPIIANLDVKLTAAEIDSLKQNDLKLLDVSGFDGVHLLGPGLFRPSQLSPKLVTAAPVQGVIYPFVLSVDGDKDTLRFRLAEVFTHASSEQSLAVMDTEVSRSDSSALSTLALRITERVRLGWENLPKVETASANNTAYSIAPLARSEANLQSLNAVNSWLSAHDGGVAIQIFPDTVEVLNLVPPLLKDRDYFTYDAAGFGESGLQLRGLVRSVIVIVKVNLEDQNDALSREISDVFKDANGAKIEKPLQTDKFGNTIKIAYQKQPDGKSANKLMVVTPPAWGLPASMNGDNLINLDLKFLASDAPEAIGLLQVSAVQSSGVVDNIQVGLSAAVNADVLTGSKLKEFIQGVGRINSLFTQPLVSSIYVANMSDANAVAPVLAGGNTVIVGKKLLSNNSPLLVHGQHEALHLGLARLGLESNAELKNALSKADDLFKEACEASWYGTSHIGHEFSGQPKESDKLSERMVAFVNLSLASSENSARGLAYEFKQLSPTAKQQFSSVLNVLIAGCEGNKLADSLKARLVQSRETISKL